jgi:hypothetical protein
MILLCGTRGAARPAALGAAPRRAARGGGRVVERRGIASGAKKKLSAFAARDDGNDGHGRVLTSKQLM